LTAPVARIARIAVTPGEPAGIGPDLVIEIAAQPRDAELVVIADPELLLARATALGKTLRLIDYDPKRAPQPGVPGEIVVAATSTATRPRAGKLDPANSEYVLFLAELCSAPMPVMLLCAESLRVALLTTHLPLGAVAESITAERITTSCRILASDLQRLFGLHQPRIGVLGLNPHAGESGQLGREEIEIIEPALAALRQEGLLLTGPLPADSAFTPASLQNFDAILAMYHDQGLPVLKHAGFGNAVNVTLGLPIIRTSVDHGTALELAGTGRADHGSLLTALRYAEQMVERSRS